MTTNNESKEAKSNPNPPQLKEQPFLTDITELRRRAREHIEKGAVTPSYGLDLEQVVQILNEALATELVCTLRYRNHYYTAEGLQAKAVADEFLEHAQEEQEHADQIAKRIRQLGGNPNFNPDGLSTRSHAEYKEGGSLIELIQEDLVAERIAIESYREIVRYFGDQDPVSRRLMEEILAKEEEHAEELSSLLMTLDPSQGVRPGLPSHGFKPQRAVEEMPGHLRRIAGS